jgi:hypothetical protein
LRSLPPKSNDTCILGKKTKNTTHDWYIKGGTFCCRCRVKYTFEETYKLYLRDIELQRTHGIPRCMYCGQSLRVSSKSTDCEGFWEKLKEFLGGSKKIEKEQPNEKMEIYGTQ